MILREANHQSTFHAPPSTKQSQPEIETSK